MSRLTLSLTGSIHGDIVCDVSLDAELTCGYPRRYGLSRVVWRWAQQGLIPSDMVCNESFDAGLSGAYPRRQDVARKVRATKNRVEVKTRRGAAGPAVLDDCPLAALSRGSSPSETTCSEVRHSLCGRKHWALRQQKPLRLIRAGEVGGPGFLYLTPTRYTVTTRMILH